MWKQAKNEMILCDTNIFINLFRGNVKTKKALEKIGSENIALSTITYADAAGSFTVN
jgi:predicted nucleic acid-binding protein